jgi:pre-peptidase
MFRSFAVGLLLALSACEFNTPAPTSVSLLPIQIIPFWQPVTGTLASSGEIQPWDFIGQAGDAIRVRAVSSTAIRLTLQTADGILITKGENQIEATLPADGIYSILVEADSTAEYELNLSYTDRPDPAGYTPTPHPVTPAPPTPTPPYYGRLGTLVGSIQSGQTLSGTFAVPEERQVYTFTANAGQYIGIQMGRASGKVDPLISLYGPSGSELATDDNSGKDGAAVLRNVRLPEDGLYTVQVWGRGFPGGYQISLLNSVQPIPITPVFVRQPAATPFSEVLTPTWEAAVNGQNISDHIPVVGQIERSGDVARYTFQGTAGQIITIGVRPTADSKLRPHIEVFDSAGALVTSGSDRQGNALIPAFLTSDTAAYLIFVTGEKGSTGGYLMSYGIGFSYDDVRHGTTLADLNVNGDLAQRGLRDVWSLDLNQDDVITAAVNSLTPLLDPVLELIAPDGSNLATDDNSGGGNGALIASIRAPISGRYHLGVTSANAAGAGAYTLVWHYVNLSPTATPVMGTIRLLTYQDAIPHQVYRFYPFYGQAGTTVQIQVIGQTSNFDPVAALLAPDGSIIAEGDDSNDDLNSRFTAALPMDGTYTVRVNGYLSAGSFELTVEALYPNSP